MKKGYNKIIACILILMIFSLPIIFFTNPKKEFSENENRVLQNFPDFTFKRLFNGKYISELENYLTDQFPYRDNFMSIKTKADKSLGKEDINEVYLSDDDYLIEKYNAPENSDRLVKVLNNFNTTINYINTNLMLVPTSISINNDLLPNNAPTYSELDSINYIYKKIHFDTINVYNTLLKHNSDYQIYYRLDHHWTSFGAYYAYVEYAKANNLKPYSLNSFDIKQVTNDFNGTLYSKTSDYTRKSDSIYTFSLPSTSYTVNYVYSDKEAKTLYEDSYLDKKDKYSYFLDNNHPLIVVTNNNINTNKELIVIKDSFANSIVPFLINHYKKIHIIDPRYYKTSISKYILENKAITDCLILYNINTIDSDLGVFGIK